MGRVTEKGRLNATAGLGDFINSERSRLFDGATPERRRQFEQAERRHDIYRAWNQICANTREGRHVTGLHYVAERDELIVYTDGASWTQERSKLKSRGKSPAVLICCNSDRFRPSGLTAKTVILL